MGSIPVAGAKIPDCAFCVTGILLIHRDRKHKQLLMVARFCDIIFLDSLAILFHQDGRLRMKISEYFNNTDAINMRHSSSLPQGPFYSRTIKDFYDDLVGPQLNQIHPTTLKEWAEMLERYINLPVPIYWIRKYESGSNNANNNKQDNRRGALTLVVDKSNQLRFAYAFISNYDAQELYNMIRTGITPPTEKEFLQMMFNGSYQLHYDPNGGDCQDDEVAYYEHRGNVRSGVLNAQGWYLAHIVDVNDITYQNDYALTNQDIEAIFLSRGQVAEWKDVSALPMSIQAHLSTSKISNGLSRRVRIINISDIYTNFNKKVSGSVDESDIDKLFKQILQASFYRFVHPCNYFLVPARKNECDFIYGRKQISIGEYKPLVEYVKNQIREKFKGEIDFAEFDKKLMLPHSITSKKSGSVDIHVCYGRKYSQTSSKSTGKGTGKTSKTSTTTRSAKLTNDQLKFQPFDDNLNGFKEYLIARGYNGMSYYSTIKAIASSESLSFKQMLDKIDTLVDEYGQSGIKADMGNRNNGGWRSALNRMQDFRNYLRDYLKTI